LATGDIDGAPEHESDTNYEINGRFFHGSLVDIVLFLLMWFGDVLKQYAA
jgi:hypothetical protein